jgi:hypothetical protein
MVLAEDQRLKEDEDREKYWKLWGPYLSERQWGTVREDYSEHGTCWDYFTHDHARRRAYRWGEDGLLGITDRECRLCFSVALWNEKDPILKERLFGLTGPEGNHAEDVKECYYYLDSTPTHSYMKALYKHPQAAYPYADLVHKNRNRGKRELEYELADTGVFDDNRYFDVVAEYAKEGPNDVLIKVTVHNRGPESATVHVLPTLWFRNTWVWGCRHEGCEIKPRMAQVSHTRIETNHASLERYFFESEPMGDAGAPTFIFTDNETNTKKVFGSENVFPYVKDAFHDYVISGNVHAVNPHKRGTKVAVHYKLHVPAGESVSIRCRLFSEADAPQQIFGQRFEDVFQARIAEANAFYAQRMPEGLCEEETRVMRQGLCGVAVDQAILPLYCF